MAINQNRLEELDMIKRIIIDYSNKIEDEEKLRKVRLVLTQLDALRPQLAATTNDDFTVSYTSISDCIEILGEVAWQHFQGGQFPIEIKPDYYVECDQKCVTRYHQKGLELEALFKSGALTEQELYYWQMMTLWLDNSNGMYKLINEAYDNQRQQEGFGSRQ